MSLLRCFIAVELPRPLQDAIAASIAGPRERLGSHVVRWVPVHNLHLTLKFLGDTAPSSTDLIIASIKAEAPQFQSFDVTVAGFGAFPSERRPRVLWVGLRGPAALASLQHALDQATLRLGYNSEERAFSPHLTIGRVRQNVSSVDLQPIRDELERTTIGEIGTWKVDAIHLYRSELKPTGSEYSKLFTAFLGTGATQSA
jgi:2'-5' RNA ligase